MSGDRNSHQRPPEDRLWGADRVILYLEAAVKTLDDLDGSREQKFRTEARKFLDSPSTVFDKHPADYIGHIRHLNTNTRGFATWCQNDNLGCELCIVHEVYKKSNEGDYWSDLYDYNEAGEEFEVRFQQLDPGQYDEWVTSLQEDNGVIVVLSG
jgi:hypothetical protein